MPVILTEKLTKDYLTGFWTKRPKRSLDSLDLEVQENEVFGFLGPNGAGKTTTLKLLMNLVFPTSGKASILGRPVDDTQMHREIGFLPEQPYFYDYLTAGEALGYYARLFGITGRAVVDRFLERVGLPEARDTQLRKFSKGMLQRFGLAQAIVHDPRVVFLDEPMSGLDPVGRREVRDLILELKKEGRTVFFSTHILPDAETLCDRVAVLARGKLQGVGSVEEIFARHVQGVEIVFEMSAEMGAGGEPPTNVGARLTRTGNRYRVEVGVEQVYDTFDELRKIGARVLACNEIRPTLEEYFMKLVGDADARANARANAQAKQAGGQSK
jgi:ABC-2 type transport system ATP-binding protein